MKCCKYSVDNIEIKIELKETDNELLIENRDIVFYVDKRNLKSTFNVE